MFNFRQDSLLPKLQPLLFLKKPTQFIEYIPVFWQCFKSYLGDERGPRMTEWVCYYVNSDSEGNIIGSSIKKWDGVRCSLGMQVTTQWRK